MKTLKFLLLFAVFVFVKSKSGQVRSGEMREVSALKAIQSSLENPEMTDFDIAAFKAIQGIMKVYFAPNEPKVDIYYSGWKMGWMADQLILEKPSELSVRVIWLDSVKNAQYDHPSIFLSDQMDIRSESLPTLSLKSGVWPVGLIYAPNRGFTPVVKTEQEQSATEKLSFLHVANDTTVDLFTKFLFSPGKCGMEVPKIINRFSTNTMTWQNDTFFPEKYENFHGCRLRIGNDLNSDDEKNLFITMTLAKALNFRFVSVLILNFHDPNADVDLIFKIGYHHPDYSKNYEFSSVLYEDFLAFTVPAGEPYSELKKMFMMFDKATWICIGVTLIGSVVVILIINCMSRKVQKFVFGRDIQTPTLNVASIFLTGSQHRTPGRNFARFMLTMFIVWSLIIRTCYQSELYKHLQDDSRKPRIQTVDELNEQNFTLARYNPVQSMHRFSTSRIKNWKNFDDGPAELIVKPSVDYTNKLTVLTFKNEMKTKMAKEFNKKSSLYFLDENSETISFCVLMRRFNPYNKIVRAKIEQIITSGIYQQYDKDLNRVPKYVEDTGPRQLTMNHLELCFAFILICLALCCVVFVIECAVKMCANVYAHRLRRRQ